MNFFVNICIFIMRRIVINVSSRFVLLLKLVVVVLLLFIFLIVIGINVKLIMVIIVFVIKGGNNFLILEKIFEINIIKIFEVIIDL